VLDVTVGDVQPNSAAAFAVSAVLAALFPSMSALRSRR